MGIRFSPVKKITMGFLMGTLSMVVAAVVQYYIYEKSPCGKNASDLSTGGCVSELGPPPISIWVQAPGLHPRGLLGNLCRHYHVRVRIH